MKITQPQINNIPDELKILRQWVCHRDKVPITPINGYPASPTDPSTWRCFTEAVQYAERCDGIGFVFSKNDPYVGVDIDHCIDDNNALSTDAKIIVNTIKSYTEKSQSGKGIHTICKGSLPEGARRNTDNGVEMYSDSRYFIMTGNKLSKSTIVAERSQELKSVYSQYVEKNLKQTNLVKSITPMDSVITYESLLAKLSKKKKEKLSALWEGDMNEYNDDHSAADLALCSILAYHTSSPEHTDKLFRQSELYRDKWDEIHYGDGRTYGQVTIEKAFLEIKEKTPWFDEKGRFKAPRLVKHLLNTDHYMFSNQQFYKYDAGVYRAIDETILCNNCYQLLGDEYASRYSKEVIHTLRVNLASNKAGFQFDTKHINLENGLLDWETQVLKPHDPQYASKIRIPITYDPDATCPTIDKFFNEVLPEDTLELIEELFGYCLIPTTRFEKAFMLIGPGQNGKSVFLNLLTQFISKEHIANETLQDLAGNRFRKAELAGKLVNIFADLSSTALIDTGYFKALVSSDDISVERKNKDPFKLQNTARMIFSANEIPKSRDNTNAYFRRWRIIRFPNAIAEAKVDTELLEKLVIELPGLLNRAIHGLQRLFTQKKFSEPASCIRELERYRQDNDTVRSFVRNDCIADPSNKVGKVTLYDSYRSWCQVNGGKPVSSARFNERIKDILPVHEDRNSGFRQWVGVCLSPHDNGVVQ
jgi:putative DNA primase/helicase